MPCNDNATFGELLERAKHRVKRVSADDLDELWLNSWDGSWRIDEDAIVADTLEKGDKVFALTSRDALSLKMPYSALLNRFVADLLL